MNNLILVSIQLVVFITYLIFIKVKFGNLSSISLSWYKLQEHPPRNGYLFTLFCWGLAIPLILFADTGGWLFFIAGSGLAFVGAATAFKENLTDVVHFTGASVAIVASLIGLWTYGGNWISITVVALGILYLRVFKVRNTIYWVEVISFAAIITGLLYIIL